MAPPERRTQLPSGPPQRRPAPSRAPRAPRESVIPPRRASQIPPGEEITQRTLVSAVVLTAVVTAVIAALFFAVLIDRGREGAIGPSGAAGSTGDRGERGPRGRTNSDVTAAAVAKAIQANPTAIGDALTAGGVETSTQTDTAPTDTSDLEDEVSTLRDDLGEVCDAVRSSGSADDPTSNSSLPC